MILARWLRAAPTWLVCGYALAAAMAAPIYLVWLVDDSGRGLLVALLAGPLTAALGSTAATAKLVAVLELAGARADQQATAAAADAFAAEGLRRPTIWLTPRLRPDEALSLRGLRRHHVFLPSSATLGADRAVLAEAVRQDRDGASLLAPLHAATCAWLRTWVDITGWLLQPLHDRSLNLWLRTGLLPMVPIALLTAPMIPIAWLACLPGSVLLGRRTSEQLARALGTADGRPAMRRIRVYAPKAWWTRRYAPAMTWGEGRLVSVDKDPAANQAARTGLLAVPRAVAAGMAPSTDMTQLAIAVLLPLLAWFAVAVPAERMVLPGERAVSAPVVRIVEDSNTPVPGALPGPTTPVARVDGRDVVLPTTEHPVRVGDTLRLAVRAGRAGPEVRNRDQDSTARLLWGGFVPVLLLPIGLLLLPRRLLDISGVDATSRQVRRAAGLDAGMPEPLGGPTDRQLRRRRVRRLLTTWQLWVAALVCSGVVGSVVGWVAGTVGRLFGASSVWHGTATVVGFVLAFVAFATLAVRNVLVRGDDDLVAMFQGPGREGDA